MNNLKLLKGLEHENVARIMDVVNTPNNVFVMYEQLEVTLQQVLAKGNVAEDEAIELLEQTVSALLHLHNKNVPHKSLSCSSIMMKPNKGGGLKVKIANPSQNEEVITKNVDWFTSPEAIIKKQYGRKGDIWGLGVVYFQLLNGEQSMKGMDF